MKFSRPNCDSLTLAPRFTTALRRLIILLAVSSPAMRAAALELASPDGQVKLTVELKILDGAAGCPVYQVAYRGQPVLAESRLGLELVEGPFQQGFVLQKQQTQAHDSTWTPVNGERAKIRDHYQELTIELQEAEAPRRTLLITFRAYNEGVALHYTLPQQAQLKEVGLTAETTQFCFTADHTTWAVYSAQANYANSETKLSKLKPGAERPLTVQVNNQLYAALTEARLVDYARMKFRPVANQPGGVATVLDAERGQAARVTGKTPLQTPWRVVLLASSPGQLLENNDLVLNLNDPCALADTSWIKPGKVIRDMTLTTVGGKACVDFCVARGLQYVEFDAGWYGHEYDPAADARDVHLDPRRNPDPKSLNLHEVIAYAKSKQIGVILYVNHLALEKQAAELFPLYEKWGVAGVKFGFVNVGSQKWTARTHEWIRQAAAHHLLVDIHDEFRDMGYRRTYPNLMTVEGIGGNETFPPPVHHATLPFTRFLTGPGDMTFCWYSAKLKPTHAHQLAISTIFFSPWQFLYWYDRPSMYDGDPALDYWQALPTTWDETRVLREEIGRAVTVARRSGPAWYVGAIHPAGNTVLETPLTFLEPDRSYTATIYSDQHSDQPDSKAVKVETIRVNRGTVLKTEMSGYGGVAVRIVPASP